MGQRHVYSIMASISCILSIPNCLAELSACLTGNSPMVRLAAASCLSWKRTEPSNLITWLMSIYCSIMWPFSLPSFPSSPEISKSSARKRLAHWWFFVQITWTWPHALVFLWLYVDLGTRIHTYSFAPGKTIGCNGPSQWLATKLTTQAANEKGNKEWWMTNSHFKEQLRPRNVQQLLYAAATSSVSFSDVTVCCCCCCCCC